MADSDLLSRYNYDEFVPAKFERWLNFQASHPLESQRLIFRYGILTVAKHA